MFLSKMHLDGFIAPPTAEAVAPWSEPGDIELTGTLPGIAISPPRLSFCMSSTRAIPPRLTPRVSESSKRDAFCADSCS